MSQKLLFVMGVSSLLVAGVCAYFSLPSAPERLVLTNSVIDFGELEQAQSVAGEFELVNRFRQKLHIKRIFESCSCTVSNLEKQLLEPGDRTKLRAEWKTGAGRGPTKVVLHVAYELEDKTTGEISLTMRGNIIPDIHYEPSELVFEHDTPDKRTIALSPCRLKEFDVKEVYCTHKAFNLSWSKETITVVFDPARWPQDEDISAYLTVVNSSQRDPKMTISIRVSRREKERSQS